MRVHQPQRSLVDHHSACKADSSRNRLPFPASMSLNAVEPRMASVDSSRWQQVASSASLLQQLSELTSQQIHNIHCSLGGLNHIVTASSDSESIWQQAEDAATRTRVQLRLHSPTPDTALDSASASLLSPDVLSSSAYTYAQLCHDLPLLTIDGVDALSSGLLAHVTAGTLPAEPFSLTLPFLYQLTQQTSRPASSAASAAVNEGLVASLSQLTAVVLFCLFPLLLTSSQADLSMFLASLPTSLPSLLAAEQGREEAERAAVPAFVVDCTDVEDEREEKLREWGSRDNGDNEAADDDGEDDFTADDDIDEEADDRSTADVGRAEADASAVNSWAELEDKLCSLIHLWHPRCLTALLQPSTPTASPQFAWEKLRLPSVLLQIQSLASQHQYLFQSSSTASTLLQHRLSTVLLSLLLSSPTLIPSYLPAVLSLLPVCSLSLDAFEAARPFDSVKEEDERICLLLLSHLCGNEKVRAATDGRLYVWRLLDRSLSWLAFYLQHIHASLSATATATLSSSSSPAMYLSLLSSLVVVLDFYLCCHPGLRAGRIDVGESLVSAGIIDQLLSLIDLSSWSPQPSSTTTTVASFPVASVYTLLCTGCGVSPLFALQCESSTILLQHLSSDGSVSQWQAEKLLLPLLLAWHALHSQRSRTTDTGKAQPRMTDTTVATGKAQASKASKKRTKLLVSALVEDSTQPEETAELLPSVDTVVTPPAVVMEALVPLVMRTNAAMRQAIDALTSASEASGSFTPLVDELSLLARLIDLTPALSSIVRPSSALSPSTRKLETLLHDWAAAVAEVRRLAGEAVRRSGSVSANESVAVADSEDDAQRRQRVKTEQRVRHAKQHHTAELQRLLNCCKHLLVDNTTSSKKD